MAMREIEGMMKLTRKVVSLEPRLWKFCPSLEARRRAYVAATWVVNISKEYG